MPWGALADLPEASSRVPRWYDCCVSEAQRSRWHGSARSVARENGAGKAVQNRRRLCARSHSWSGCRASGHPASGPGSLVFATTACYAKKGAGHEETACRKNSWASRPENTFP